MGDVKPRHVGSYSLLTEIASGAEGDVYRALAPDGQQVALKVHAQGAQLSVADGLLLGPGHPGLASCIDVGRDLRDGRLFTVSELVAGQPLGPDALQGDLDPARARRLAARLLAAVAALHERGLLHRDIKDDNVLLEGGERPVLIDLGLACPLAGADDLSGTPRAMAPELFAGRRASVASDLWSTGLVLAEALLGERLFLGRDPVEMAEERADFPGLSAADHGRLGDERLAGLLDRLLDPDPAARPESARAALASLRLNDADDLLRVELLAWRASALSAHDPRREARVEAIRAGRGVLALCPAPGDGLPEALAQLEALLAGVADAPHPEAARALQRLGASDAPGRAELRDLAATLGRLQPQLVWLDPGAAGDAAGAQVRRDLAADLSELEGLDVRLAEAPSRVAVETVVEAWLGSQPLLLQRLRDSSPASWAELDQVLAELVRTDVVSFGDAGLRVHETRLDPGWPAEDAPIPRTELEDDARRLLDLLALSPVAVPVARLEDVLGEPARGLEGLLARGLVSLQRSGVEARVGVSDGRLRRGLAGSLRVAPDVRRRLALCLSEPVAGEARAVSLEDRAADVLAEVLVGPDVGADAEAPAEGDPARLTDLLVGAADSLRRLGRLDRAAAVLSRGLAGVDGDKERARRLHVDRVDVLIRAQERDAALRCLDEAEAALGARAELVVRRARLLALAGRAAEAADAMEGVDADAMPDEDAVLALQIRAFLATNRGHPADAAADLREALRRHGKRDDRRSCALLEKLGLVETQCGRHDEAIRYFEQARSLLETLGQDLLTWGPVYNIARALFARGDRRRALETFEDAVGRAERSGDTVGLLTVLNGFASALVPMGRLDQALQVLGRAERLARERDARRQLGFILNNTGRALAGQGRHDEALQAFAEALDVRTEQRDHQGRAAVALYRGPLHLRQGRLDAARVDLALAREALAQVQAPQWEVFAHLLASDLARADERLEEARAEAAAGVELAREAGLSVEQLVARDRLARAGADDLADVRPDDEEPGPALAELLATRAGLRVDAGDTDAAHADLEHALATLAESPDGPAEVHVLLTRLEIDGRAVGDDGDPRQLGDRLARMGRDLERASALVDRHDLAPLRPRVEHVAQRLAEAQVDPDGPAVGGLVDRLRDAERLLDINKRLNTEHDTQKLLDLIIDSAIDLTGAARGFMILFDGQAEHFRAARNIDERTIRDPQWQVSHSVARRVVREGLPLLTANAIDDPRLASAASISELQLLSILCVPMVHRGRSLGAVYLDHPQVVSRFQESHLETVSSLAEQAAIALENARLSEGLRSTNDELRQSRDEIERLNEALKDELDQRVEELEETRESLDASRRALGLRYDYSAIVTRSPRMHEVLDLLDRITATDFPVVIHGESGTGKELIARAIHFNGLRRERNFLSINCAAIAEPLIESELFGHVRGAFTGADRDRKGLFAQAHEGTLFLDEIGDMSLSVQTRLLRVLQEGEFLPVGGREVIKVDVRILCATHRDLKQRVAEGEFREDLYYRLMVANLDLPPLRDRTEDIALLLSHFLERHGSASEGPGEVPRIDPEALALLEAQSWPGNVRELENFVMNLLLFAQPGEGIRAEQVRRVLGRRGRVESPDVSTPVGAGDIGQPLKARMEAFERDLIQKALERAQGNKAQAARDLGVGVRSLYKMIERLGL